MKAITIWQPWATLISHGAKPYEFRGWHAHKSIIGQRIAIHAGTRQMRKHELRDLLSQLHGDKPWQTGLHKDRATELLRRALKYPSAFLLGHVVCTAVLGEPVSADEIVHEFGGPVNDSDRNEHANWAWPMLDVEPIIPGVPAKGMQGFWNWDDPR